jgi:hypothetical protein
MTSKKSVWGMVAAVMLSVGAGCARESVEAANATPCATESRALDGRAFRVAVSADRGGAASSVEIAFASGRLDASDARDEGYVPTTYVVRSIEGRIEFDAEARSASAVRRFRGRIEGSRIVGTVVLVPHGAQPAFYSFEGQSI